MNIAAGALTSIAFCWTAERSDGAGVGLTSHDRTIEFGGVTFRPNPAITPAAISRELGLAPHASEVSGALSGDAISAEDLIAGRWDGARIALVAVDWINTEGDAVQLLKGSIGEVTIEDERFTAELRGAASILDQPLCPTTSPECRAEFGDQRCRVDLAGRTLRARVMSAAGSELILDSAIDERFLFGRIRFVSGANCGWGSRILAVAGTTVQLRDIPRAPVVPSSKVKLQEGCDKRLATCSGRFANAANFRGEPHLPGNDLLTRYPGA